MKYTKHAWSLSAALLALVIANPSFAGTPPVSDKELLEQFMDDLQTDSDNKDLRTHIIQLVARMHPKPHSPPDLVQLEGQAEEALAIAKSPDDFKKAVDVYKQASVLAPWIANIYFDLAVAEEKAGDYNDAVDQLNLYLIAKPNAPDKISVEHRIGVDTELAKGSG